MMMTMMTKTMMTTMMMTRYTAEDRFLIPVIVMAVSDGTDVVARCLQLVEKTVYMHCTATVHGAM